MGNTMTARWAASHDAANYRFKNLLGELQAVDLTADELNALADILEVAVRRTRPIVPGVVYLARNRRTQGGVHDRGHPR